MNSDGPQVASLPLKVTRCMDSGKYQPFFLYQKYSEKMNYGHRTGSNLLQTDADGIISPDILFIVHKAKVSSIYLMRIKPQLHIIRFQKGSASSLYCAYSAVLCSSAHNRHSYLVPRAALRKMTSQNYPMGSKMNSDGPQRTPVCPSRSHDAWIRVNISHFSYTKNTVKK